MEGKIWACFREVGSCTVRGRLEGAVKTISDKNCHTKVIVKATITMITMFATEMMMATTVIMKMIILGSFINDEWDGKKNIA